ncbi:hypothetical protein, partial [Bartonella doshiae]
INFYGPAFNALTASGLLTYVSDNKQTSVGLENHQYDFVGGVIGGNPATLYQVPTGSNRWNEAWKILTSYPNVHACYGHADQRCQKAYGASYKHHDQIDSIKSGKSGGKK